MMQVRDNSMVPPGGKFIYRHEDGFVQSHPYYRQLLIMVKNYRNINHLPVGLEFEREFNDNICRNAIEGVCIEKAEPTAMEKATRLTKALARWAMSGFKVRKEDEVERIRAICQSCDQYGGEKGFLKVICKQCGCSNKKLYLYTEHCPLPQPKW